MSLALEAARRPSAEEVGRTTHGVVARIVEELVVGGGHDALHDLEGVVGLDDSLRGVAEGAVAYQHAEPACREIAAVIGRDLVERACDADTVVRPLPCRALDRQAQR